MRKLLEDGDSGGLQRRVLLVLICLVGPVVDASHVTLEVVAFSRPHKLSTSRPLLERWRGGETEQLSPTKKDKGGKNTKQKKKNKKKKKKKSTTSSSTTTFPSTSTTTAQQAVKLAVNKALHETDAADALGQAIRDHADDLRNDETRLIHDSMRSLGWAMGAADHDPTTGGIQIAPGAVLANYFLKSHGGAHGLQSLCSVLAAATGFAALLVPTSKVATRLALIKRCLIFAMVKHVSGLLAGSFVAAQNIPLTGYRRAVEWMKDLANDPVSQYVFYTAILLLWLPSSSSGNVPTTAATTKTTTPAIPLDYWWKSNPAVPIILLAPILLREVLSTVFVVSDILLLQATLAQQQDESSLDSPFLRNVLIASSTIVNAAMSLLVTPAKWRSSSVLERQAILAKLVSRLSIAFELAAGLILAADVAYTTAGGGGLLKMIKQAICLRLYLQFLWIRRRKIHRLAQVVRGGAGEVPFYLLGVLMDPRGAMGLTKDDDATNPEQEGRLRWKDYATVAFDLDSN